MTSPRGRRPRGTRPAGHLHLGDDLRRQYLEARRAYQPEVGGGVIVAKEHRGAEPICFDRARRFACAHSDGEYSPGPQPPSDVRKYLGVRLPRHVRERVEGQRGIEGSILEAEGRDVGLQQARAGSLLPRELELHSRDVDADNVEVCREGPGDWQAGATAKLEHAPVFRHALCQRGQIPGARRRRFNIPH